MTDILNCLCGVCWWGLPPLQYEGEEYVPPKTMFVKMLVNASNPYAGEMGAAQTTKPDQALPALRRLSVWIRTSCPSLVQTAIPEICKLMDYLKGVSKDTIDRKLWKRKLILFLHVILENAKQDWRYSLMDEFSACVPKYAQFRCEKEFLYRCMGTSLAFCHNKDKVKSKLWKMCSNMTSSCMEDIENFLYGFETFCDAHQHAGQEVIQCCLQVMGFMEKEPQNFLDQMYFSLGIDTPLRSLPSVEKRRLKERINIMWNILRFCSEWASPDGDYVDQPMQFGNFLVDASDQFSETAGPVQPSPTDEALFTLKYFIDLMETRCSSLEELDPEEIS
ncbi:uncharacterized protein [Ambystoma mexicanum]|uniref:uncharacterized protein n=1 Tax=Ambystoma mexicanum TaxID=8296 RepID=UPI0037E89DA5